MSQAKPKVLIFLAPYLPGLRGGGPIRSVGAMIDALKDDYEFFVGTRDRDFKDKKPYDGIVPNRWTTFGNAKVYYARLLSPRTIVRIVKDAAPDLIYMNGFFCTLTIHVLLLRMLRLLPKIPYILAPRGEFNPGALEIKSWKKKPFLELVSHIGLYNGVTLHASSEHEKENTSTILGAQKIWVASLQVAVEVTAKTQLELMARAKDRGEAKFVCISRITKMKNIEFLIDRLMNVKGRVIFDLFGPLQEPEIWTRCMRKIKRLPENITVNYRGEIEHKLVAETLSKYEFFVMPTLGENFGHSILEAMAVGLPVIISDRTPWTGLGQKRCGRDVPLEDEQQWTEVLQWAVDMRADEYEELVRGAVKFASEFTTERSLEQHRKLFNSALEGK